MRDILDKLSTIEQSTGLEIGDSFGISFSEDFEIGTEIVGFVEDGIVIELDSTAFSMLEEQGIKFVEGQLVEGVEDKNPCWKGYHPVGTKQKNGKTVPNCVPEGSLIDQEKTDFEGEHSKRHLEVLIDAATEIQNLISDTEDLPEWIQSKIAKAVEQIDAVRDYIDSSKSIDEADYRGRKVTLGKKLPGDVKKYKVYVRKPNGNIVKVNFGDKNMRIKKSNPARRKSFRARHNCKNPGPRWKARYWSCRNW